MTFAKTTLAKICGFALFSLVLAGTACAAETTSTATSTATAPSVNAAGKFSGRMMELMDANKDGSVTKAEAKAYAIENFKAADTAKDGELTHDDLTTYVHTRPNLVDADKDGIVSKQEYLSATGPFARLDAPGNNAASDAEFAATLGKVFNCLDKNDDGQLSGNERPLQGLMGDAKVPTGKPAVLPALTALDGDGNGALSESEWLKTRMDKFNDTDKNKDGVITPQDMIGAKAPDGKACEQK